MTRAIPESPLTSHRSTSVGNTDRSPDRELQTLPPTLSERDGSIFGRDDSTLHIRRTLRTNSFLATSFAQQVVSVVVGEPTTMYYVESRFSKACSNTFPTERHERGSRTYPLIAWRSAGRRQHFVPFLWLRSAAAAVR